MAAVGTVEYQAVMAACCSAWRWRRQALLLCMALAAAGRAGSDPADPAPPCRDATAARVVRPDRPAAPAGASLLTTVRIGGSIKNASALAWSWGAGAAAEDPPTRAAAPAQEPLRAGGGRPHERGAGPRGRGRAVSAGKRQTWTQTQVIQGRGMLAHGEAFSGRTLFLGGTGDLVERDLWEYLAPQFGEVADVDVIRHYDTPRGFAFVTFADSSAAAQCMGAGSFVLKGHTVHVSPPDQEAAPRQKRTGKFAPKAHVEACNKVFLGGTRQLTEGTLLPMLERFGEVTSLHVMSRPENMLQCAGFAFATYSSVEEAQRLVNKAFITVANVTLEARFADDKSRPGVSEKVSLREAEELVEALKEEIERVAEHAPGGHRQHAPVVHEGIVFAPGTPYECAFSQQVDAADEALDEAGRSVSELVQLLEDAEALRTQVYDCLGSRLRAAAEDNDVAALRQLVAQGASANAAQRQLSKNAGDTAHTLGRYDELAPRCLYLAAAQGHVGACRELLAAGADVNAVCRGQELEDLGSFVAYTPLKVAAERGLVEVVELLLASGADADFADESRWSIVHWAACNNHAHVVRALAAAGADINARNLHGRSPLALALTAGAAEAAQALRDLGALDTGPAKRKKKPVPPLRPAAPVAGGA